MIRVLIVDDSPTARLALRSILERAGPDIEVVGEAHDGPEAVRLATERRPDIVTMDVYLGSRSGFDVAAEIMQRAPCPILVVTGVRPSDRDLVVRALAAGALDVVAKPPAASSPLHGPARDKLLRRLRALAAVPVVTRRAPGGAPPPTVEASGLTPADVSASSAIRLDARPGLLAVGASTGAPAILAELLQALPRPVPFPITIAQHIAAGFSESFAAWLGSTTGHDVRVASASQTLTADRVYLAPHDRHLVLVSPSTLEAQDGPPHRFYRPSIDLLFDSIARYRPMDSVAVLLSGMGDDGVRGLLALRRGGTTTLAQAPETCLVDSMPARAIEAGAVTQVLAPPKMAELLREIASARPEGPR